MGEPQSALLLSDVEDSVVKLLPELAITSSYFADGFAELGADGEDASSFRGAGGFPLVAINARCSGDEVIDAKRGRSLLCNHNAGRVKNTVEWHLWTP